MDMGATVARGGARGKRARLLRHRLEAPIDNNRIALAPSYATIRAIDLAGANLGDLVLASAGGVWLASSDPEAVGAANADVLLLRFSVNGSMAKLEQELALAAQIATTRMNSGAASR